MAHFYQQQTNNQSDLSFSMKTLHMKTLSLCQQPTNQSPAKAQSQRSRRARRRRQRARQHLANCSSKVVSLAEVPAGNTTDQIENYCNGLTKNINMQP